MTASVTIDDGKLISDHDAGRLTEGFLEIRLLGEPSFEFSRAPFNFVAPPKTLPLLAYMLLNSQRSLNREAIATMLWPDAAIDAARANLRRHLYYLKKTLPRRPVESPWFFMDFQTVAWNTRTPYKLDVDQFMMHSAARGGERAAVRSYTGNLLEGFDEEWLTYHRERLRNLYLSDLTRLIHEAERKNDLERGLEVARLLLESDPWREDAVRHLIRFKHLSGDRAGAVAEYDRFKQRLKKEMDVEPMPETAQLYQNILPSSGPLLGDKAAKADVLPPEEFQQSELVGREPEVEVLKMWWQHALGHHGNLLLIGGEAGIGKSSLLSTLCASATQTGGQYYVGHTTVATGSPYQSIIDVLRSAAPYIDFQTLASTTSHYAKILVPEIMPQAQLGPAAYNHPTAHEPDQLMFFAAISDMLEAVAKTQPVLVCLEDLHWASNTSIALLGFLVRRLQGKAVALAGTYRDEDVGADHPLRQLRRQLMESKLLTLLPLSPLSKEATAHIAQRLLNAGNVPKDIDDLYERSGGNPFFIGELLRNSNESASGAGFPGEIQDIVRLRLDRLSKTAMSIAESAAVIGRSFTVELLLELTGLREQQIMQAISELVSKHIVRESANSGEEYVFSHYVIQTTIYDGLHALARRRKHSRLAFLLEDIAAAKGSINQRVLAWHYERAEMKQHAATAYVLAAQQALRTYANAEAERYASQGLDLAAMPALKMKALLILEDIHKRSGQIQRQAWALTLLEAHSANVDEAELRLETLARRIEYHTITGASDAAMKLLHLYESELPITPSWRGRFLVLEARAHRDAGRFDEATKAAERALALFEEIRDEAAQLDVHLLLIQLAFQAGKDWETLLQRARSLAGSGAELHSRCRLAYEEYMILRSTSAPAAYDVAANMLELALATGDRRFECRAQLSLAELSIWRFEIDRARQYLSAGESLGREVGQTEDRLKAIRMQALLELLLGHFSAARELLMRALREADTVGNIPTKIAALNTIGYAYLNEGKPHKAAGFLSKARELTEDVNVAIFKCDVLSNLAEYHAQLGENEQAIATFEESLRLCRQLGKSQMQPGQMAEMMLMYLGAGELGKAQAVLNDLLPIMEHADSGWHPQQAYWAVSCTYSTMSDEQRAHTYLQRAYGILSDRLSKIPDADSKKTYVSIAFNSAIASTFDGGVWPRLTGKLTLLR